MGRSQLRSGQGGPAQPPADRVRPWPRWVGGPRGWVGAGSLRQRPAPSPAPRTRAANGTRTATSSSTTPSSFEQAFRAIDDCLRKEAGCGTELDYTEQTSWLLFLKYLDGLEDDRAAVAALEGRSYSPILEEPYRWSRWAAPKNASGQLDHHASLTGDDLRDFVNVRLFPYLERADSQSKCNRQPIEHTP